MSYRRTPRPLRKKVIRITPKQYAASMAEALLIMLVMYCATTMFVFHLYHPEMTVMEVLLNAHVALLWSW